MTKIKTKTTLGKTTLSQRQTIIDWLKIPSNFSIIVGSAAYKATVVSGAKLKKTEGFKSMAIAVNVAHGSLWDHKIAKNRFETYMIMYKNTVKAVTKMTGFIFNSR